MRRRSDESSSSRARVVETRGADRGLVGWSQTCTDEHMHRRAGTPSDIPDMRLHVWSVKVLRVTASHCQVDIKPESIDPYVKEID